MDRAVFIAAAIEMLHTATLVHDDLIDGSLMRRGVETLNTHWSPGATVLTGDYIFARAAYLASQACNVRLMQCFAETLMDICNGEVQQMFNGWPHRHACHESTLAVESSRWHSLTRGSRVSRREYERRIRAKTASLIAMSAKAGAILAGAEEEATEALRTYGERLGLAFQIVDDVLDFVADEETLGKPVGSDLRQGLVTLPLLLFLEAEPDHPEVCRALQGSLSEEVVQEAVRAVAGSPAIERALEVARWHADRAKQALDGIPGLQTPAASTRGGPFERKSRSSYLAALLDLADFTVRRRF